eukprot:6784893-Lingulodinium_polyedra.AAC.1
MPRAAPRAARSCCLVLPACSQRTRGQVRPHHGSRVGNRRRGIVEYRLGVFQALPAPVFSCR